jgi:hypothetical protein
MNLTETKGGIDVKEDISLIEHLDFGVECDYKDCSGDATHRLICPKCSLFEFMCAVHARAAIEAPKGSYIIFDKSCTHRVDMYDCGKEPI